MAFDPWTEFYHKGPDIFEQYADFILNTIPPPSPYCLSTPLSRDIWEAFNENKLTLDEYLYKINLWRNLNNHLISVAGPGGSQYFSYGLYMGGSTLNGFGLKNSNVDFSLYLKEFFKERFITSLKANEFLKDFEEFLKQYENALHVEAKPCKYGSHIIYQDLGTDFHSYIVAYCRHMIQDTHLLYHYGQVDWRVRPLMIVIKLWAEYHNITGYGEGCFTNYHLELLVISFLQCGVKPAVLPNLQKLFAKEFSRHKLPDQTFHFDTLKIPSKKFASRNRQDIGDLLIEFFRYYSKFNFKEVVISIRFAATKSRPAYAQKMPSRFKNWYPNTKHLFIEEPIDHPANSAKSVTNRKVIEKAQWAFAMSYERLRENPRISSINCDLEEGFAG